MSVRFARRRTAFRAALTAAAVTGAVLIPASGAFADTAKPTATKSAAAQDAGSSKGCTVTKTIKSVFGGWTVELSDGPAGPKAVLKDEKGKTVATVDKHNSTDSRNGLEIIGAEGLSPVFRDRNQGGPTPWRKTAFPKPPKGCFGEPGVPGTVTHDGCTVTRTINSVFGELTVDLSNSPAAGPKAVLKGGRGEIVATVDRKHPENPAMGLKITGAYSSSPKFLDRTQGGTASAYRQTAFPALSKGCATTGTTGTTPTGGQTKTLPKGSVAAGAEGVTQNDKSALVIAGGAAAAAAVAGLGFVVLRRRSAAATA
ncbi:hypothetical protein QMK19_00720 [Streptomyces sp. H10-C2]|uniref:hypothetical protein n=1 Tax=unclassified Streptomyces TaxID=2593676 RepID=UPI0024BACD40|nr:MULTISPECIES: hypothetical protein [unclassified Streptomyces]MDJ0340307.1 hypothetical protein [Streptomyces sp. PH10-H1]MDJ0368245.1 hypothetical protein [Streptomyces sp. H10-C2]